MLTNHFSIDQNTSVSAFLKGMNDKKNMHYIVLDTSPKSIIDVRTLSTKIHNRDEKLKNLKRAMPWTSATQKEEILNFLINSGENIIEHQGGFYDFLNALEDIKEIKPKYLNTTLREIAPKEIFALNPEDKISAARTLFTQKKINILPVIEELKVLGEVRTNDLLASELFEKQESKDYFSENHKDSVFSLGIDNLMNNKPHTINANLTLFDAINLMLSKKLPSIIVTNNDEIYSIVSFKDIFKLHKAHNEQQEFEVEIVGEHALYEDELRMVKGFALKSMKKISKISDFNHLKIHYKIHGDKDSGHMRKGELKLLLSAGNKVLTVSKEISPGTSDSEYNDKVKGKWNFAKLTQESLKILEQKSKSGK